MKQHLPHYYKARATLISYLGGECIECGSTEDLQFDHVDPATKVYDVSSYLTRVEIPSYIWEEIEKCQLLCKPHHKAKSDLELEVGHGEGKWGKRNCKCEPCKKRKREAMREYRSAI